MGNLSDVEAVFPVVKTGPGPRHYTVVFPYPVNEEAAQQFNSLFKLVDKTQK